MAPRAARKKAPAGAGPETPPPARRSRPRATPATTAPAGAGGLADVLGVLAEIRAEQAALRAEVEELTRRLARPTQARLPLGGEGSPLADLTSGLQETAASLREAIGEVPRAAEFEPLAEHIYEFARTAPALREALEDVPKAVGPIQEAVRALQGVAETLQAANDSFSEALLRVPRAEDYEPLSAPLAEFARVSPVLVESLADVLRVARPLAGAVEGLDALGQTLRSTQAALADSVAAVLGAGGPPSPPAAASNGALSDLLDEVQEAEATLRAALASLPRDPHYAKVAAQLREIATVSPSLMEWLREAQSVSAPLLASVSGLEEAAEQLGRAGRRLRGLVEPERTGRS